MKYKYFSYKTYIFLIQKYAGSLLIQSRLHFIQFERFFERSAALQKQDFVSLENFWLFTVPWLTTRCMLQYILNPPPPRTLTETTFF